MGTIGETLRGRRNWEGGKSTYPVLCKTDDWQEPTAEHRKMDSTVCNYVNGKKEWLCLYVGMIHFVYTWNEYNFVNQLYSNKIKKKVTPFKEIKINKSFWRRPTYPETNCDTEAAALFERDLFSLGVKKLVGGSPNEAHVTLETLHRSSWRAGMSPGVMVPQGQAGGPDSKSSPTGLSQLLLAQRQLSAAQ